VFRSIALISYAPHSVRSTSPNSPPKPSAVANRARETRGGRAHRARAHYNVTVRYAVALVTLLWSSVASANGRFPAAQHVLVGPGDDDRVIALRVTFGLVLSADHGASFHWVCEEALGYGGTAYDPTTAIDNRARVHAGLWNGAKIVAADRCGVTSTATLAGESVRDFDTTRDGATIFAVTTTGFVETTNHVYRSDDGDTFTALAGLPGTQLETVEVAASDGKRVYVSGLQLSPRKVVVQRSDDAGATLRALSFPHEDALGAYIAGIDRDDPDTFYVRVLVDAAGVRSTILLRSSDGGGSFVELVRSKGLMLGFANDGDALYYGGPDDGLHRSLDRGKTWSRLGDARVRCLRAHKATLWICGTEETDGYALAKSTDRGATITPVLQFGRIKGPPTCDVTTPVGAECPARWAAVRDKFLPVTDVDAGVTDATPDSPSAMDTGSRADATVDAGERVAPPDDTGCSGCSASRGRTPAWFALVALALLARRPRGRR